MARYDKISNILNSGGISYKSSVLYPDIPLSDNDLYITSRFGDRLDNLAYQFYNDYSLYWIIQIANPDVIDKYSYYLPLGVQVRIPDPTSINGVISSFNGLNS